MRPGQQEAMVENDGVGGNGVGKTSLILEGGSPKQQHEHQPGEEVIVVVIGNKIVRTGIGSKPTGDHADQIVHRNDDGE